MRRLAMPAIMQALLDPNSPLAPMLRDGPMATAMDARVRGIAASRCGARSRPACRSLPDPTRGNPATFHGISLVRELELLGAGRHAADRRAAGRDLAPRRPPRSIHARPHFRRARWRISCCSRRIRPKTRAPIAASCRSISAAERSIDRLTWTLRTAGVRMYADRHARRSRLKQLGWEPFAWLIYSLPYLFSSLLSPRVRGPAALVSGVLRRLPGAVLRRALRAQPAHPLDRRRSRRHRVLRQHRAIRRRRVSSSTARR